MANIFSEFLRRSQFVVDPLHLSKEPGVIEVLTNTQLYGGPVASHAGCFVVREYGLDWYRFNLEGTWIGILETTPALFIQFGRIRSCRRTPTWYMVSRWYHRGFEIEVEGIDGRMHLGFSSRTKLWRILDSLSKSKASAR